MVTDEIGSPTYAKSLAEMLICILEHEYYKISSFPSGIYNCSGNGLTSRYDFASNIIGGAYHIKIDGKEIGIRVPIEQTTQEELNMSAHRPKCIIMNNDKIYSAIPVEQRPWLYDLQDCITNYEKKLNEEKIPCPSEYKKQCGLKYHNSNKLEGTSYWTYSTVRKILQNEMYIGNMVQNKSFRQICKKQSIPLEKDKWIIVENTHEAIIDKDTWNTVQNLLERKTRHVSLNQTIHIFAGFIKCGDCERALVKLKRKEGTLFRCGSYHRYGASFCSPHDILEADLEKIILADLNVIIQSVKDVSKMIEEEQKEKKSDIMQSLGNVSKYEEEIERIQKKKDRSYENYLDDIITKEDYLRYKTKYEEQISLLQSKIDMVNQAVDTQSITVNPWIAKLLNQEPLEHLDRETVVEMISMIYIYKDNTIKIVYNFSNELETLLQEVSA